MKKSIIIKNIKKAYSGKTVVNVKDLSIKKSEVVAFIGKNGSGKTTLLKLISGVTYQNEGTITNFGIPNTHKKNHRKIRYVLESGRGYYDYLTAYENLRYFSILNDIELNKNKESLLKLIQMLDFEEHMEKYVSDLSQGNRQKLSIIASMICNPEILCLDEPTNGLDIPSKNKLINLIEELRKKQKTVILTTHDLYLIKKLDCRCIFIDDGQIIKDELASVMLENINTKKLYTFKFSLELENELQSFIKSCFSSDNIIIKKESFIKLTTDSNDIRNSLLRKFEFVSYSEESPSIEELFNEVILNV